MRGLCDCGVQALQHMWRARGQPLGAGSPYLPCPPLGVSSCYTVAQVLIVLNENLESDIRGLHKETLS